VGGKVSMNRSGGDWSEGYRDFLSWKLLTGSKDGHCAGRCLRTWKEGVTDSSRITATGPLDARLGKESGGCRFQKTGAAGARARKFEKNRHLTRGMARAAGGSCRARQGLREEARGSLKVLAQKTNV